MKKTLLVSLLVSALASFSALADTIKMMPNFGPFNAGNGGEFTVLPDFAVSGYSTDVSHQTSGLVQNGTFQTFCLEKREIIRVATYNVEFNQKTVFSNNILTKGVAWLYAEFAAGTLAGYDYGAGRLASALQLQKDIWFLMGQGGVAGAFTALVTGVLGAEVGDAANGFRGVSVLNVWHGEPGSRENARQDVLVITTPGVPDGGLTLALLGMGLTGLGMVSRRVRK